MVKNTGTTDSPNPIRALNQPLPVDVKTDPNGCPKAVNLRNKWVAVGAINNRWRIDDEWWRRNPISRTYYECIVDQKLSITLYKNMFTDKWYRQTV